MPTVHLLDYVAGNVRSLANAIEKLGYTIEWIRDPKDIEHAEVSCNHCVLILLTETTARCEEADILCAVIDSARRGPFRALHDTILPRRLPWTYSQTH